MGTVGCLQPQQLAHIERRKILQLARAEIPARSFYPQDVDFFAGQRIRHQQFRRRISASRIGDPLVGSQAIGSIDQPLGGGHLLDLDVVPQVFDAVGCCGGVRHNVGYCWQLVFRKLDDICSGMPGGGVKHLKGTEKSVRKAEYSEGVKKLTS